MTPPFDRNYIKLIRELSAAALKAKCYRELALWRELRAINCWGSGWLNQRDACHILVSQFGYSQAGLRRILRAGNGPSGGAPIDIAPGGVGFKFTAFIGS